MRSRETCRISTRRRSEIVPGPEDVKWSPGIYTAKSLCASSVAFRPGSHVSDVTSTPSVDVSG